MLLLFEQKVVDAGLRRHDGWRVWGLVLPFVRAMGSVLDCRARFRALAMTLIGRAMVELGFS